MSLKKPLLISGMIATVGLIGFVVLRQGVQVASPPPNDLGVKDGQLAPCPDTPNCVSSQANDAEHQIAPISYSGSTPEAKAALMQVLAELPRSRIVADLPDYVYVETRSFVFGFVDDNEFFFDDAAQVIHVRAAARLGRSDLGANRQRIEMIRQQFEVALR